LIKKFSTEIWKIRTTREVILTFREVIVQGLVLIKETILVQHLQVGCEEVAGPTTICDFLV
jgi:hypothetical protein